MKETKSLKVILTSIFIFAIIYNLLIHFMLESFHFYHFENTFFTIRYILETNPEQLMSIPQFLNWLLIIAFVFFSVMLILRIYINKKMNIRSES